MKNPEGFILMSILLFLLLLSLLAWQALESALVEIKLQQLFNTQHILFQKAHEGLKKAEKSLRRNCPEGNKNLCVTVELIDKNTQNYKITSSASQGNLSVTLQSICVKSPTEKTCQKRVEWEQVENI